MAISFVGSSKGTNTLTVPSHQEGDLILVFASGSGTEDDIEGLTRLNVEAAADLKVFYKYAETNSETIPTLDYTDASICCVYRNSEPNRKVGVELEFPANPIISNDFSTNITFSAVSESITEYDSWVISVLSRVGSGTGTIDYDNPPWNFITRQINDDDVSFYIHLAVYDSDGIENGALSEETYSFHSSNFFGSTLSFRLVDYPIQDYSVSEDFENEDVFELLPAPGSGRLPNVYQPYTGTGIYQIDSSGINITVIDSPLIYVLAWAGAGPVVTGAPNNLEIDFEQTDPSNTIIIYDLAAEALIGYAAGATGTLSTSTGFISDGTEATGFLLRAVAGTVTIKRIRFYSGTDLVVECVYDTTDIDSNTPLTYYLNSTNSNLTEILKPRYGFAIEPYTTSPISGATSLRIFLAPEIFPPFILGPDPLVAAVFGIKIYDDITAYDTLKIKYRLTNNVDSNNIEVPCQIVLGEYPDTLIASGDNEILEVSLTSAMMGTVGSTISPNSVFPFSISQPVYDIGPDFELIIDDVELLHSEYVPMAEGETIGTSATNSVVSGVSQFKQNARTTFTVTTNTTTFTEIGGFGLTDAIISTGSITRGQSLAEYLPDIQFVSSASSDATTVTMPSHQAGDLLIGIAFRGGATSVASPTGWTTLNGVTTGNSRCVISYKYATSDSETSGTWSNAHTLTILVYRSGKGRPLIPSMPKFNQQTSNTLQYPSGTSSLGRCIRFGGNINTDSTIETLGPSGAWTARENRTNANCETVVFESDYYTKNVPARNQNVGGGTSSKILATFFIEEARPNYTYTNGASWLESNNSAYFYTSDWPFQSPTDTIIGDTQIILFTNFIDNTLPNPNSNWSYVWSHQGSNFSVAAYQRYATANGFATVFTGVPAHLFIQSHYTIRNGKITNECFDIAVATTGDVTIPARNFLSPYNNKALLLVGYKSSAILHSSAPIIPGFYIQGNSYAQVIEAGFTIVGRNVPFIGSTVGPYYPGGTYTNGNTGSFNKFGLLVEVLPKNYKEGVDILDAVGEDSNFPTLNLVNTDEYWETSAGTTNSTNIDSFNFTTNHVGTNDSEIDYPLQYFNQYGENYRELVFSDSTAIRKSYHTDSFDATDYTKLELSYNIYNISPSTDTNRYVDVFLYNKDSNGDFIIGPKVRYGQQDSHYLKQSGITHFLLNRPDLFENELFTKTEPVYLGIAANSNSESEIYFELDNIVGYISGERIGTILTESIVSGTTKAAKKATTAISTETTVFAESKKGASGNFGIESETIVSGIASIGYQSSSTILTNTTLSGSFNVAAWTIGAITTETTVSPAISKATKKSGFTVSTGTTTELFISNGKNAVGDSETETIVSGIGLATVITNFTTPTNTTVVSETKKIATVSFSTTGTTSNNIIGTAVKAASFAATTESVPVFKTPVYIQYVGSIDGTNTATLPTHIAGDLILCFAYNGSNSTIPTLPEDWTNVQATQTPETSFRVGYIRAIDGTTDPGTWTNATHVIYHIYRGARENNPVINRGVNQGTGDTVTYMSAVAASNIKTSWFVNFAGHKNNDTELENPPDGMTLVQNRTE